MSLEKEVDMIPVQAIIETTICDMKQQLPINLQTNTTQTSNNSRPSSVQSHKTTTRQISYITPQNLRSFHYFKFFQGKLIPAQLFIINPKTISSSSKTTHYNNIINQLTQHKIPFVSTIKQALQYGYFNQQNCRYRVVIDIENLRQLIKHPRQISLIEQITVFNSGDSNNVSNSYQQFLECKRLVQQQQKCTKISKMLQSLQGYIDSMKPYVKYYKRSISQLSSTQQCISERFLKPMLPAYFSSHELSQKTLYRAKLWAAVQSTRHLNHYQTTKSICRYKHFIQRLKSTISSRNLQLNDKQAFAMYIDIDREHKGYLNTQQNMVKLLALYKKESFYYNVLNSMLRVCRRISDFEPISLPYAETYSSIKYFYDKFIKENNYKRQKMALYRGCRLEDIQKMSIGGYYEMLGFLSCSKNIKVVQKQFLSHEDSCMMIINIKQRQIHLNRLCYDHGLIDYQWLQEYRQLMKNIISKDLQYEQQVMLNSFSLLRLVDRRKQQIDGKQRWVVECDLVTIDELRQRMQQLRRSLDKNNNPSTTLMTTTTLTTKLIYSPSPSPSSIISTGKTASTQQQQKHNNNNKNNSQQQQQQLRQIQKVLCNLQYFQQQMIKIKDIGDLYGQFGEIDNQQNYYRQVLMEQYQNVISSQKYSNNNNGNKCNDNIKLSSQAKRQIQFKYAQSMMKCGKLQLAYNWLMGQSDLLFFDNNNNNNKLNNNKQHNKTHKSIKTPYLNLSNYNGNQQQQIKTILRQNDDQVSLRESLLYRIEELNKKDTIFMSNKSNNNNNNKHNHFQYYQNKYLIANHTYQLSQSHYNSNNLQQSIQQLNKTKLLIKQCHSSNILINSKLSSHQQRKTQGCFDFVNVVSKLFGINNTSIDERKNQKDMVQKNMYQQKIKVINKQLIELQIKVNGLLIKCYKETEGNRYKETEGNHQTNRNNIKQISSKRNNNKIQQLVQQTLHAINIYNQKYPEYTKNTHSNYKQTNIQLLLIQASIKLQNNLYQQAEQIINVLQTTKNEIERSNPYDQRLPKLYHQIANIQSQQLLTTLSSPCDKYTLTNNNINNNSNTSSKSSSFIITQQQKAYRQSQIINYQYKLKNTNKVFNKQLYSQKINEIENNYNKSLHMMQVNGQQNTVKYIKVQNQLGYFYREHNMLLQSDSMANRVTQSFLAGTHTQGVLAYLLLAKNHVSRGEHKLAQQQLLLAEDILHNAIIKATLIVRKSNNKQEYQSEYKHSQMYFEIEMLRVIIYNAVEEYNKALEKLGEVEGLFGESAGSGGSVSNSGQNSKSKQQSKRNKNNNNTTTKRLSNMMLINQAKATMLAMGYKTLPKQMLLIQWQQYLTKSIQYAVQYLGEQHTRIGDYYCSLIKYMLNEVSVNIHRSINAQVMNSISLYIQKAVEVYSRLAFDHPYNCNLFYIFYLVGNKKRDLSTMGNNNNSNSNNSSNNKSNKDNNNIDTSSQISPIIDTLRYCIKLTTYRYKQHVHINLIKTIYQQFRFYFSLIQSQGGVEQVKQTIMMINSNSSSSSSNKSNANNKYTQQKCFYYQQTIRIGNELSSILNSNHSLMTFVSQLSELKEDHKLKQDFIRQSKMADQKVGIKLFVDGKLSQLKDTNTNKVNVN